MYMIDYTYNTH